MRTTALAVLLALTLAMAGCIKFDKEAALTKSADQQLAEEILGEDREKLIDAASLVPKNYSFAEQQLLPPVKREFKATVTTEAVGGYEAERDEGGIDYRTVTHWYDLSGDLLPGQPAEVVLKVYWDASEFNSADLDLVVDVPGTRASFSPTSETWNWNYAVKTLVLNTVGVQGQPARVGVQISSALVNSGFDYQLDAAITYVKDVLTPYHAWALSVPEGAGGLVFESEKAGGDEHLRAQFIVLSPADELVTFIDFNDISIPTQSVYVPTPEAGEYVFYAYFMHGGFLRVKADVPLATAQARTLQLVEKATIDSAAPQPGVAGKDYLNNTNPGGLAPIASPLPKDDANAAVVAFTPEGPFPLRVTPTLEGQVTTMAKITLKSPLGVVAYRTAIARYEDASGRIGYTSDHEGTTDHAYFWHNIQKGAWSAEIVNNGPQTQLGHVVLTYQR